MKIPSILSSTFALIPLRGKTPVPTAWPSTRRGQYEISELEKGNYGVIVGAAHLVVDVDPRNFAPNDKPLARLVNATGGAAAWKTFTVRTGGGGLHLYFSLPSPMSAVNQLKEYMGVEFKTGTGRQVVGPGSIHPDTGKEYTVAVDAPIAPIPPQLLAMVAAKNQNPNKKEETKNEKGTAQKFDDHEAAQGRFISYLENCAPLAVEGEGGDNTAYKVAAAGRDLGLSAAVCGALMDAHWSPRCSPPWEADELAQKVAHAYRYGKREVGNASPSRDFSPLPSRGSAGAGPAAGDGATGGKGTRAAQAAPAGAVGGDDARDGTDSGAALADGAGIGGDAKSLTWELDRDGKVKKTFHNLMNYMRMPRTDGGLWQLFGYNAFTGQVEFLNPAPWHRGKLPRGGAGGSGGMIQDHDLKLLKGYLVSKFGLEMPIGAIEEAVTNIAHAPGCLFHPVREYLDGVRGTWDGVPRLSKWLADYAGAVDNGYVRAVARKTLCAAVKRVYQPGVKFDHILVLEGKQGVGKSRLVRALGGKWTGDFTVDPSDMVRTVDAMQGKWLVEMAEMSTLFSKRVEGAALKAFITRDTDRVRQAYGRLTREFPRQCIFIGTMNPEGDGRYLNDPTGNRRFWPVEVGVSVQSGGRVDVDGLKEVRDQLFAEAIAAVEAGEELYMDNLELESEARNAVGARQSEDAWTERILTWLNDPVPGLGAISGREFVTAREVYVDALGGVDKALGQHDARRIANVMRAAGWETGIRRVNGVVLRGYMKADRVKVDMRKKENRKEAPASAPDSLDGLL